MEANVEVFTIAYNEEFLIPHFIRHYRERFNASITVFDNQSTDRTREIALQNGCKVISYNSNNQIRDDYYLHIKNYCWKESKTDWVIVCDVDEFLEVPFEVEKYTIISAMGYDIVGGVESRMGVYNPLYCKRIMFKPKYITSINYLPGCHSCNPQGQILLSPPATLLHRKYISEEYVYKRHLEYKARMSKLNIERGWGKEYLEGTKEAIQEKFDELRKNAVLIP